MPLLFLRIFLNTLIHFIASVFSNLRLNHWHLVLFFKFSYCDGMYSILLLQIFSFLCLFHSKSYTEVERQREILSLLVQSPIATMARAGLVWSCESGAFSGSPLWVQELKALNFPSTAFPGYY